MGKSGLLEQSLDCGESRVDMDSGYWIGFLLCASSDVAFVVGYGAVAVRRG